MKVPFFSLEDQYKSIKPELEEAFSDIVDKTCFIGGSYVSDFEGQIAAYLGASYAIGCSNGTDALILGLRAVGVSSGDEVITTAFSFFATAEAIAAIGAVPVFVDVKQDDYTIDPEKIEAAISDKTKAILPVHIFGCPCEMDRINSIAEKYGIKVVEDCAQAIGSEYKGRKAGTLGDIGCFSFYPTKNLGGAGDGGMITTMSDGLNTIVRALREHGAGKNGADASGLLGNPAEIVETGEKASPLYDPYKYYNYLIGYNSRLDAIQAAVLSIKLKHLDEYNGRRAKIASMYMDGLTDKVRRPVYPEDVKPCWHQFVVRSDYKGELCSYLSEHEVGSGTFYPVPLHRQKAFHKDNCKNPDAGLPVAEELSSQTVCLPVFPELTDEQVGFVIDTVNEFYKDR